MAINRDKVHETAQKFIEKGKYDKAAAELRRLVDADPSDVRSLHKVGELELRQGLFVEALDTFDTVAALYTRGGFAQKAVAVYKQIREIVARHLPQQAIRYSHVAPKLAELYIELGLMKDAITLLDEYAGSLIHQQREPEALPVFQRIVQIDPTAPIHQLRLAEALSRARDVEGAVTAFRAAAALLIELGRRDDAIVVLERLLYHRADPDQARVCAELYLSRARPPHDGTQALAKLQICFQANPRDVQVLTLLSNAFALMGQRDKAMEIQKEIARLSGRAY